MAALKLGANSAAHGDVNAALKTDRYVWFITGPTACGKTTVAKYVAEKLNLTFLEGDDYHPKANIEKMSRGEGLTDEDRANWLEALRDHESVPAEPGKAPHLVITCSALKRTYRDLLREGSNQANNLRIRFVFLDAPEEVLVERATNRKGHYAKAALVHSQFEILERPDGEPDCIIVDVNRPMEETERDVLEKVEAMLKKDNTQPSAIPEGRL